MDLHRICRFTLLLGCAWATVAVSGCGGSSTADVAGTIKIRGQAPNLKGLQLCLLSPNGGMNTADINEDGTYKAINVPVGDVKVSFVYLPDRGSGTQGARSRLPQAGPKGAPPPKGDSLGKSEAKNPIPAALRDGSTSDVVFKVVSGNNVFDYDVRP